MAMQTTAHSTADRKNGLGLGKKEANIWTVSLMASAAAACPAPENLDRRQRMGDGRCPRNPCEAGGDT